MEVEFRLIGDFTPTELESGLTIVAPGLIGRGSWVGGRAAGETRAFTGEQGGLDTALAEAGAEDRHTLLIEAPTPVGARGTRGGGPAADDELLLQVPLAADEAAVVMYVDEAGGISFHYPQQAPGADALSSRAFGAAQMLRFRLPLRPGTARAIEEGGRGLVGKLVAKVIKVLVVKVMPDIVGGFAARRVQAWERSQRGFEGLHGGASWAELLDSAPRPVTNLAPYVGRRSLLLVHGTTSTTAGAFAGMTQQPQAMMDELWARYEGRVLGFNHHTMSVPVVENLRQFCAALAACPGNYRFDVICHSRGGLVARALAHLTDAGASELLGAPWQRPANANFSIDRIVFVATPNAGTALAIPERIPAFVDRMANVINQLPDAALTIAGGALLSLAGAVAEAGLPRLPGLMDQQPGSRLQQLLAPPAGGSDRFFAFSAEYEPTGNLVDVIKDGIADRLFEHVRNDLVVPSAGVATTPYFALPSARHVAFNPDRGVHHSAFFAQPEMARLIDWLPPQ